MKIILIEDNQLLAKSLIKAFKREKIFVEHFVRGDDGENFIKNHHKEIAVVVLDLMLPGKSGEEVCRDLRAEKISLPILMLTAKDTLDDKLKGFDLGADDYLTKPFEFEELLARVKVLARRKEKEMGEKKEKITKSVEIDFDRRSVYKNNQEVPLTAKEFSILELFTKNRGKVLSRNDIFSEINDFADVPWSNSIDVYIKNLRKKLFYDEKDTIKTIRGVGYRLD